MIPLADENPSRSKPYVVYVLVALNAIVFLIDRLGAQGPIGGLWNWSMIPWSVVHNAPANLDIPVRYGQMVGIYQVRHAGFQPEWITIFTSMFMHGSFIHIGGNMLYLWIFGNNVEDAVGHFRFLLFYLLCGVIAALAHISSNPASTVPTLGASGAIAGVLGAYLFLYPGNRVRTLIWVYFFVEFIDIPAVLVLGVWFATQLMNVGASGGMQGGVAYWAHIGGFISGIILIILLGGRRLKRNSRTRLSPYEE